MKNLPVGDGNTTLPIFSLQDLLIGNRREELRKCLFEIGCFYLSDYGLLDQDHKKVEDITSKFFNDGTDAEKGSVIKNIPGIRRGYSKLDSESTAQVTNKGNFSDYAMCYSMGISENVFPCPEFEQVWTRYFNEMYKISKQVAEMVLTTTGTFSEPDMDKFLDCEPVLRFRAYPDVPKKRCADEEPLRMAPHYDISIVTLVQQTPCPNGFVSLQCQIGEAFVDVPYIRDTVVVMCGAVSPLVCNGNIKPITHQVLAPPSKMMIGSSRTSSTFFLRPKSDFTFSIQKALDLGYNICLQGETATFKEWMGANYIGMETHE